MNMQVLRRSRKPPQPGDIFVYRLCTRPFGFGRVIRTDTKIGNFEDVILLYFYRAFARRKQDVPELSRGALLLSPLGTTRTPWTMGYFETVESRPLARMDVLAQHCFRCDTYLSVRWRDEYGKPLSRKSNPSGLFALSTYRTIDAKLSDALGIQPAPDTVEPPLK